MQSLLVFHRTLSWVSRSIRTVAMWLFVLNAHAFAQSLTDIDLPEDAAIRERSIEPSGSLMNSDSSPSDASVATTEASFASYPSEPSNGSANAQYFEIDYLLWWVGRSSPPPLLTQNPDGTVLADAGILGNGSTQILSSSTLGDWPHSGLRLRGGRAVNNGIISHVDWAIWHLFEGTETFGASSQSGSPILARPFFNAATGAFDAQILGFPGIADGSFYSNYTRQAIGAEALGSMCLKQNGCRLLQFFTGYQFFWIRDALNLHEDTELVPGGLIAPGTRFVIDDEFEAGNAFHLIPFGLSLSNEREKWSWNVRGSLAFGFVSQTVEVYGNTQTYANGNFTGSSPGGLLALQTNSGRHERVQFAWVPQLQFNLRRQLSDRTFATLGYSVINLNNVAQAAEHVPSVIDPNNIPPVVTPAGPDPIFAFHDESLWIHGFNFGLVFNY